ncbi:hypothetical protein BGZ98_010289 [Dissophora globulifera]|nr:hypothetical protein BGZ98_010289 [Dissophora globulifera]
MSAAKRTPFDLPELRLRISRFAAIKDAISCSQVCKEWTHDFAGAMWHTVDFRVHKRFAALKRETIKKYGHHIRVVKGLVAPVDVAALQCSTVCSIRSLAMEMTGSLLVIAEMYDILRRNSASLKDADIVCRPSPGFVWYFVVDTFVPSIGSSTVSKLSVLKMDGFSLTRQAFSSLLRICPLLWSLDISNSVLSAAHLAEIYQHSQVTVLIASLQQIFRTDPQVVDAESLLVHFPNLQTLHTWNVQGVAVIPMRTLKEEIERHNPLLKSLLTPSPSSTVVEMLVQVFQQLRKVCVKYKNMTPEILMAILMHRVTITDVQTFCPSDNFYQQTTVPTVQDHLRGNSWMVQLVPQTCHSLRSLILPEHEMFMDEIERVEWRCSGLEELRVRISGLDTAGKINLTLQLWAARRKKECLDTASNGSVSSEIIYGAPVQLVDQMYVYMARGAQAREIIVKSLLMDVFQDLKTIEIQYSYVSDE